MKKFALIGAAGYIAPRHMEAIHATGNKLVTAYDPYDSVGVLDTHFPEADFFVEFERFDRHLDKLNREGRPIDYLSICSPNYLHDSHIRFGLRNNAHVICEKPLVLNPWNSEALMDLESRSERTVYTILQLRLHPSIIALKKMVDDAPQNKTFNVDLTYITSRGKWYYTSWKGDDQKSGGIATNIGIHFFDALAWIFGDVGKTEVHVSSHDRMAGVCLFKRARVRWFLSINKACLPENEQKQNKPTFRSISIDGTDWEFSTGFEDLHTESYRKILAGNGFSVQQAHKSIELVHALRTQKPIGLKGDYHPLAKLKLAQHPFLSVEK